MLHNIYLIQIELSTGEKGVIEGSFGLSGKIKARISDGLKPETFARLSAAGGKKKKGTDAAPPAAPSEPVLVKLMFKRYVFDEKKRMIQL